MHILVVGLIHLSLQRLRCLLVLYVSEAEIISDRENGKSAGVCNTGNQQAVWSCQEEDGRSVRGRLQRQLR